MRGYMVRVEQMIKRSSCNDGEYFEQIADMLQQIHAKIPQVHLDLLKVPVAADIREENYFGVNYKRVIIYLLTNGCEWALKEGNGCVMCGHLAKQLRTNETLDYRDLQHQFRDEFRKLDFGKHPVLNLYNNGSFFNDREIPKNARTEILEQIKDNTDVKVLVLESRPEYINEDTLEELTATAKTHYVEIAVGLEVIDDLVRLICINKGFRLESFDLAISAVNKMKNNNINMRTYVLLKPPFLTEREGIEHAIRTIGYAGEKGCSAVSLEACTIQEYTLTQILYESGNYRPPWLWSIVEVIKKSTDQIKLVAGLFQFFPSSQKVPYNCDDCSERVIEALKEYNRTFDLAVFDHLDCDCKKEWYKEINEPHPVFEERIPDIFNTLKSINIQLQDVEKE